jgi:hypothetical protein
MSQRLSAPFVDTVPFIRSRLGPFSKGSRRVHLRRVGIFEAIREGKLGLPVSFSDGTFCTNRASVNTCSTHVGKLLILLESA